MFEEGIKQSLSAESIEQLRGILKSSQHVSLNPLEAFELANDLLGFYDVLLAPEVEHEG